MVCHRYIILGILQISVTVAGVGGIEPKKCSRGVNIVPDVDITSAIKAAPYDVVVLPGGNQGAQTFAEVSISHISNPLFESGPLLLMFLIFLTASNGY